MRLFASTFIVLGCCGTLSHAQTYKLSGALQPVPGAGDVKSFRLSEDGTRVVYLADQNADDVFELFATSIDGGGSVELDGAGALAGFTIEDFQLSADGERVVYKAAVFPFDDDDVALFSAPMSGGTPVRLDAPSAILHEFLPWRISPDGNWVVYFDRDVALFSVPIDGNAPPTELDDDIEVVFNISDFAIAPDSSRVVYRVGSSATQLWSVPIAGGTPKRLNLPLQFDQDVANTYDLTEGGLVVFFVERPTTADLFVSPIDGSASPLQLAAGFTFGGQVQAGPSGDFACFTALDGSSRRLYSVPIDGSAAPLELNGPMMVNGGHVSDFWVSPNEDRVVYVAEAISNNEDELFSVGVDGQGLVQLYDAPSPANSVNDVSDDLQPVKFSPDATYVLFTARVAGDPRAFSVPVAGGPVVQLDVEYHWGLSKVRFTPDGEHAILWRFTEIHSRRLDGSTPVQVLAQYSTISPPPVEVTPDARVVYVADHLATQTFEVFTQPFATPGSPTRISDPMDPVGVGDVLAFELSPDGSRAVFLSDREQSGVPWLFSAPTSGDGPLVELYRPQGQILDFAIAPSGDRVVLRDDVQSPDRIQLFSVPVDGSSPAVRLHAPLPNGWYVGSYRFDAAGTTVFYGLDHSLPQWPWSDNSLYAVPIDGSQAPTTIVTLWNIDEFEVTRSGTHAIFLARPHGIPGYRLYSVATDGSSLPIELSGSFVANGGIASPGALPGTLGTGIVLSPDDQRVAFRADAHVVGLFELFSVPIDGSAPRVEVSAPLAAFASSDDVDVDFAFSPDGARIVSRVGKNSWRLFSSPADGSSPAVQLSDSAHIVKAFAVSPSSARVVYGTDRYLVSVPIAGGQRLVLYDNGSTSNTLQPDFEFLSGGRRVLARANLFLRSVRVDGGGHLVLGAQAKSAQGFEIAGDARRVVYDGGGDKLFSTPVSSPQADPSLCTPLHPFADFQSDRVTSDGSLVVFLADSELEGAYELFASRLGPRVDSVAPEGTSASAPQPVTIRGAGFVPNVTVSFGHAQANVQFVDSSELVVTLPAASGPSPTGKKRVLVDVTVSDGVSKWTLEDGFTLIYETGNTPLPVDW